MKSPSAQYMYILVIVILFTVWGRVIDDLYVSLGLDKAEWLEDIERGESSLASYLACVDECISERECRKFEEGLDNKVKLAMYREEGRIQEVFAWRK